MKCILCNRRKPSRRCPAKDVPVCSRCCGSKRRKEIECPQECNYLSTYQEVSTAQKKEERLDSDAREDYRKGMRLYLERDYESAIRVFDGILARYPRHVPSIVEKANCLLQDHRVEDAIELFDIALETDPDSIEAMRGKALCLYVLDDIEDALDVLDDAIYRTPKDCGLLTLKADCLLDIDLPYEAKIAIEDVLKRERENDHALEILARAQFALGEFEEAARNLKRAIKISPDDTRYEFLSEIYFVLGRPEDGFNALDNIDYMKGADGRVSWLDKGKYCHESGFEDYAILCCDRAIERGEDAARCNVLKARISLLENDDSKAGELIDAAINIDPDCIDAVRLKMIQYYTDNEWENALEWAEKVIELNPEDVGARFFKAKILKHLDRRDEFHEMLRETRERVMDFDTFGKYGIDLYNMGEYREAVWFLEEALDLREDESLRDALTSCYSLLKDIEGMGACIRAAEDAHPDAEWLNIAKAVLGFYRDDMALFKKSVEQIKWEDTIPGLSVELLIPDMDGVLDFLDTAARCFPDNPYIIAKKAVVRIDMGDIGDVEESIALLDRAISLKKSALFYIYKLKAQIRMNSLEDALETAAECSDRQIIPVLKGIVFKKMGREEDAREAYDEYINARVDAEDAGGDTAGDDLPEIDPEIDKAVIENLTKALRGRMIMVIEELVMDGGGDYGGDGEDGDV